MARKVLASFKSVLKDAKRRGLIVQNVAAETKLGAGKRHRRKLEVGSDVPTPAEVKTLIDAGNAKAKAAICVAALAGLRASELRGLRWSDLDLGKQPSVTIAQRADAKARIGSPKSESSRRTVPLGETTVQALKAWKLAQPPKRALIFGTSSDRPDMLNNLTRRLLAALQVRAGVALQKVDDADNILVDLQGKPLMVPKYGWHALRHYAISAWLAAGIDLKTVQRWAGHATLTLTLDTYGHMIPRQDDNARIAAAERLLG
jgi:integrase